MRKEIKTGLFAVIVVAVALFMIEFLKGKDIFSRNNTFYIIYPSVEGLSVSTQITAGGYPAGIVSDIAYNPGAGDYTLTASIPRQFDIPADSYMEVYSADILGTKKLRIVRGTSPDAAAAGDTLPGRTEPDMLVSLLGSLQPAASGLDSLLRNLNTAVSSVNTILNEENRASVRQILIKLDRTASDLSEVAASVRSKSPEIEDVILNIHSISQTLDSTASAISTAVADAGTITASLKDARIGETADSLRSLVIRLQNPDGSIGKLLASDSLYNALTGLSGSLDSLVNDIRKDPKKYIKISVF